MAAKGGTLSVSCDFGKQQYALLELDDELIGTIVRDGVTIKGEAGDEACLCTSTQTFLMRLAESSNTHYLVRGAIGSSDQPGVEICASVGAYFELKASVPRVIKLRTLLAKRVFDGFGASDGDAGEDAHSAKRLTTPGLRAIIQCSDAELTTSLDALHAVELGGEWRMLSTRYQHDITEAILLLVIQHGWSHAHLCVRDVVRAAVNECADFEAQAVYHCLSHVTLEPLPLAEASAVSGELTCALDPRKVSVFHAESVLRKGALLPTDAFVKEWETRTADLELAEPISLKMLGGIAVEVSTDKGPHVQWLPANTLPSGTKERLASLFKIKPAWRLDEIEAYLDDVLEEEVGRTKEQILIQHARQMKDDHGEMLFVERR